MANAAEWTGVPDRIRDLITVPDGFQRVVMRCPHRQFEDHGEVIDLDDHTCVVLCPACWAQIEARILRQIIQDGIRVEFKRRGGRYAVHGT